MLKEIHHRVKNNLQVITGLLSLQSSTIKETKIKELFRYAQYRVNSMAMVHEMLYKLNDLSKIDFGAYLKKLIDSLVLSMKEIDHNIKIKIDVQNINLNINTAVPLGLLINEIITNSLKFGLKNDGEISCISINIDNIESNSIQLLIGDDGIGFSNKIDDPNSTTLGLQLIQNLAYQLRGTIKKDSTKQGTNYILSFEEL